MIFRFRYKFWSGAVAIAIIAGAAVAAQHAQTLAPFSTVTAFSSVRPGTSLPAGWVPMTAPNIEVRTRYTLVDDGGVTVVRADSAAGASGLSQQLRIAPAEFPWLRWRWKITKLVEQADLHTKAGDDFPARLYVMFDYPLEKLSFFDRSKLRLARALFDPDLPAATLCYVWDNKAAAGTVVSSAYTDRVKLVVVESGAARVRQWVDVERNIASDFRRAFGEDAPLISGIAIVTDTDNTGGNATSFYGDISFHKQ